MAIRGARQSDLLSPDVRALSDLAAAVAHRSDELEETLERICTTLARSFGFERVIMHRFYETTAEISPLVAYGHELPAKPEVHSLAEEPNLRRALEAGRPILVADDRAVSAPLLVEGHCLGFMGADRGGRPFDFGEEALRILEVFTAITAVFLEKALEHRELERLNEVKSQFVELASHELRAPATSIYGAAATLRARAQELDEAQQEALQELLFEQSNRLRILVEELLDLSRIDAGQIRITPEPIDVCDRLQRLVDELFPQRAEDITVRVEEGLVAQADPSAFDRIVANLVANALRHGAAPVTIEAGRADGHIRVVVEDSGPGVPPEFVSLLFERFTRVQQAALTPGAGLGLSIAQSLARAHNGELSYRSANPRGAHFEVELPAPPAS
jgi:signal transduction histidine kinase